MDVSVIIPALNEEKIIEKSLRSLQKQDFDGSYEVIVVDGQSTDRTVNIAKRFADRVLIAPKKGAAFQRNFGAAKAKGKFLAFLDADTIAQPEWLSSLVESLNNNAIAVTGPLIPLERGAPKSMFKIANHVQKNLIAVNLPLFWGASCAFNRESFEKIKGFDQKLPTSEDHDISLRIRKKGVVAFNEKMIAKTSYRRFKNTGGWLSYISIGLNYFILNRVKEYELVR